MKRLWNSFLDLSIRTKLTSIFFIIAMNILIVDIFVYLKVNSSIYEIDQVYSSNVDTNEISDNLDELQGYIYEYLTTRSSDALENYYRSREKYSSSIEKLNQVVTDNEVLNLERNIHNMSLNYLKKADLTIQEKRGGNIQVYKTYFEETSEMKQYISDSISTLNNLHFKQNSVQYTILLKELQRIEVISLGVIIVSALLCMFLVYMLTGNLIGPLIRLADSANKAAEGEFQLQIPTPHAKDEIYTVTSAFNSLMVSIREYIAQIRQNMERENQMQEKELLMETHLKDAQLKYLQAQINPHFLFNSLNAGAQLAAMEDAERTCGFIEKMADFFRYNVRKMQEKTTLLEEIQAVDNYIYIMNVRYDNEIHYEKLVDTSYYSVEVPSMILQPLVENALNYGIHDISWEKMISLEVRKIDDSLYVTVKDNGIGMSRERIDYVLSGKREGEQENSSSGIGIDNVMKRLELFFKKKGLLSIKSKGIKRYGTTVTIQIPLRIQEGQNVSNITG